MLQSHLHSSDGRALDLYLELTWQFEAFHHVMFANAKLIGERPWTWFATTAGISDLALFEKCVGENREFPSIARDRGAGEKLGVDATPTFLINDLEVVGFVPLAEFDSHVRKALRKAGRLGS